MNGSTSNAASNNLLVTRQLICYSLIALFGICIGYLTSVNISLKSTFENTNAAVTLNPRGLHLFRQHDRNGDDLLTPEEFIPIAKLVEHLQHDDVGTENSDPHFEIMCAFRPLIVKSMSKVLADEPKEYLLKTFSGLLNWKVPNKCKAKFKHKDFKSFLPTSNPIVIGKPLYLVKSILDLEQLPKILYEPPPVHPDEFIWYSLYTMFHLRPFIYTRFPPQGTVALVRAFNDEVLDIVFRSHVEFQLNEHPQLPFWFTPSQFKGRLVISRNGSTVYHFHMFLPTNRRLNVDIEWLNTPSTNDSTDNMEVDIGFVPQMELFSSLPQLPDFEWNEEVPPDEAYRMLEKTMYPFKEVEYYPFEEAFQRASAQQKLVHNIVLWGALDDQSC